MPSKRLELHLITMGPSHYSEKARWALERSATSFKETKHLPGLHFFFLKKIGGGVTVPKLIIRDGDERKVLHDSSDIVVFSETLIQAEEERLYPADKRETVRSWEEDFNSVLGPQVRTWAYCHLAYHRSLFGLLTKGISTLEKVLGFLMVPVLRRELYKFHGCGEPNAKNVSLSKVTAIFEKVNGALEDGRAYICGDRFTAADLTFAALAGPAVLPPGYGGNTLRVEDCPKEMAESVKQFRDSPAGKHVLRLYETQRHTSTH